MLKQIKTAFLMLSITLLTACGFHFQNGELIPQELHTLKFESSDPYSDMSMAMRKQLLANNISLVEQKDVPVLRITKVSTDDEVASVFKQGREAEKMLMLQVDATVQLPNQEAYPISAKVSRTFFDNSRAALAKSSEREMIWSDMREQVARKLISKMVALQLQVQTK
ncbi:LPS assembly lipoprotein LptE [Lonepinella sp. MS14437]|uniref:LPS-assembly lipoprotein LptE n=1 Tax=Lonepinella sp. MS14437 TaxID=3003620 RepID=UPI0036DB2D2E